MTECTTKRTIYHGHLVVASTFTLLFVTIGSFNSAGLYLNPMSASFPDSSKTVLALTCTLQIVAGLISSFAGGILQDYLERRNVGISWLFFGSGVFLLLGSLGGSVSPGPAMALVCSFVGGIGIGGGLVAAGICVLWFERSRGTMLLLGNAGAGLGNIFFSAATTRFLEWYHDDFGKDAWRPTMRAVGILRFGLCAVASVAMRLPRPGEVEEYETMEAVDSHKGVSVSGPQQPHYGTVQSPIVQDNDSFAPSPIPSRGRRRSSALALESIRMNVGNSLRSSLMAGNLTSSTIKSTALDTFQAIGGAPSLRLKNYDFDPDDGENWEDLEDIPTFFTTVKDSIRVLRRNWNEVDKEDHLTLRDVALSKTSVWLNLFTFVVCFPYLNMQVLLPSYTASIGMSQAHGGQILGMLGMGMLLSNLSLGPVTDRVGAVRLLIFAFTVLALLFFVLPLCISVASLSAISFFYGFFYCTIASMPLIILADAYGESSSEHILAMNGIVNMAKLPGYLSGPSIAGFLVEYTGGYYLAAVSSGVSMLLGTAFLVFIPSAEEQQIELKQKKCNR